MTRRVVNTIHPRSRRPDRVYCERCEFKPDVPFTTNLGTLCAGCVSDLRAKHGHAYVVVS